jgi:hypothetical protein
VWNFMNLGCLFLWIEKSVELSEFVQIFGILEVQIV